MGTLFVVATPIGNLEDISIRAIKTLLTVDIIACEDTRRTGSLLSEIKKRYASLIEVSHTSMAHLSPLLFRIDEHTEFRQAPELIQKLQEGKSVALVSDAGTPLISDPGFLLVFESIKRGIKVISIPGPSAVLTALTSSGLPANNFLFIGYLPETSSKRKKQLDSLIKCFKTFYHLNPTIVFYCAPHKLIQTLEDFREVFGDIPIVIARELTKMHEEVVTMNVSEALTKFAAPKGEFTILFRLSD